MIPASSIGDTFSPPCYCSHYQPRTNLMLWTINDHVSCFFLFSSWDPAVFLFLLLLSLVLDRSTIAVCAQTVKDRALIKTKRFAKISDHNFCCFVVIMSMTHHHHLHLVRNAITTKTTIASTNAQCTPIMCKLLSMVLCVRWKPQFRGQAPGTHTS